MHILITKDSATIIAREVKDLEEAKLIADQGFHVEVVTKEGNVPLAHLLNPAPEASAEEAPAEATDEPADEEPEADRAPADETPPADGTSAGA